MTMFQRKIKSITVFTNNRKPVKDTIAEVYAYPF
jgi:hypothetical protein